MRKKFRKKVRILSVELEGEKEWNVVMILRRKMKRYKGIG